MKTTLRLTSRSSWLALLLALSLLGCASEPTPADYADQRPRLDLRQYFNGPLTAHGMFTDRAGRVVKRFTVQMVGRWDGDQGVLEEDFSYSDGTRQRRVWRIADQGQGRYTGQADDVVGTAEGHAAGNALQWRYTLRLPVDGKTYDVQFDDWMILMDQHTMLNKAAMSKFGLHLGDVTLSFHKP
ncbi:MAG: DUF3833 domain-containing protein [Rubrivivax sp.]|nr:MAG: DUF3833 domain-containing protein [Rubrivivax sp.]